MSLINDALKRASETKKQTGDPPPPVTLNPVDYAVRPNPAFRILVVLMLLSAVAFGIWFLSKWQEQSVTIARLQVSTNRPAPSASAAIPAPATAGSRTGIKVSTNFVIRDDVKPAVAAAPEQSEKELQPSGQETPAIDPATARTNAPDPAAATPASEPTNTFPRLKLQSIVYRLSKPAVVINGEMLFTGDTIKEVRIVKIDRMSVTVEWRGETNVLSLPRL